MTRSQGDLSSIPEETLYQDIRRLIESARTHVATQVNQSLVLTYWQIGKVIAEDVLAGERAPYGATILKKVSARLTREFGSGFSYSSLTRMAKFHAAVPDRTIVATLSQQLSWSHFVELIKVDDALKRDFYIRVCADGRWSVRTLRERMDSMLFERSAISKQPEVLIRQELARMQKELADPSPAFSSRIHTCSTFSISRTTSAKVIWKMPYSRNWSNSFWNSVATSLLWGVRGESRLAVTTTISTCSFTTGGLNVWCSSN